MLQAELVLEKSMSSVCSSLSIVLLNMVLSFVRVRDAEAVESSRGRDRRTVGTKIGRNM